MTDPVIGTFMGIPVVESNDVARDLESLRFRNGGRIMMTSTPMGINPLFDMVFEEDLSDKLPTIVIYDQDG